MTVHRFIFTALWAWAGAAAAADAASAPPTRRATSEPEQAFLDWIENNGGTLTNIGLGNFQYQGRGIMAMADINADDEVMTIPLKLMFTTDRIRGSKDTVDQEIARMFTEDDDMVLASLLHESFRGQRSFYAPYLALLPRYVPSLLYFSPEALAELQDPDLEREAKAMQSSARSGYFRFVTAVNAAKWDKAAVNYVTYERYLWGLSIINSRGLRFRGKVHLAPLADMFNYAPHGEYRRATGGDFFLLHHRLDSATKQLTISADRRQPAGTQLSEDYGDNSDKIYLQYHGFVADENPFRCVKVTAPAPVRAGRPSGGGDDRMLVSLFDELQLSQQQSAPSACVDRTGEVGRTLQVYLTALSFDDATLKKCLAVFERNKAQKNTATYWPEIMEGCGFDRVASALAEALTGGTFSSQLAEPSTPDKHEAALIQQAFQRLQQFITDSVPAYPTTLEEDEQQLQRSEDALKAQAKAKTGGDGDGEGNSSTNDEDVDAQHKQLALKYRVHAKRLWVAVCGMYGVDYMAVAASKHLPRGDAAAATALSSSSSPATETEPEYVALHDDNSTSLADKLRLFNEWFRQSAPQACKVEAVEMPLVRIGTRALSAIKAGDTYLSVPQSIILDEYSALTDTHFRPLLRALRTAYKGRDDFHELLLFLLHERLVRHRQSKYWSYLRLLPTPREMDVPTTWALEDIHARLKPSFVANTVAAQKAAMENMYKMIAKVKEVELFFPPGFLSFDTYQWASVILDSRSIWWEGKRHLVPMLDFVNCAEGPDPTKVHSTSLQESLLSGFTESYAVTKAAWAFSAGEQVLENYGQANHIYFTYHGFALEDGANTHDCVHLEFSLTPDEVQRIDWTSPAVRAVAQELRMRAQDSFHTCLDATLGRSVWLFVALKDNRVKGPAPSNKDVDALAEPTPAARAYLVQFVDARIRGYESHFAESTTDHHSPSRAFLQTEWTLLKAIRAALTAAGNDEL